VLITGAASGMGRALALRYADEGATLVLADTNAAGLGELEPEVTRRGGRALAAPTDVSSAAEVSALVAGSLAFAGGIDVLVNCAGVGIYASVAETTPEQWTRILGVNLFGTLHTTLALLPHMRARRSGVIVNVASMSGVFATPFTVPYCTSKFAVVGFSRGLAAEVARDGVRVVLVNPGVVRTPFARHATRGSFRVLGREVSSAAPSFLARVESSRFGLSAEEAARRIRRAADGPSSEVALGLDARILTRLTAAFPGFTRRILALLAR
jgi:meso-butanediol dehydrogenase/(S,S)-butanediol dehydrogenase/diacetyl reductase